MKKSILLGSAAALVAVTGAQAADLPVVEPVDYVKVCDAFGAGFHYIPGTETCLKFSGFVRAELGVSGGDAFDDDSDARTFMNSSFELVVNASSMTEIGMIVGQFAVEGANEGSVAVTDAWITIGENILVGREASRYDFGGGYGMYDGLYTDEGLNQFTFIMPFGNGVSFTLGLENSEDRQGAIAVAYTGKSATSIFNTVGFGITDGFAHGVYGGMEIPEIVASLRISQGWGSAQVSVAAHQIRYAGIDPTSSLLAASIFGAFATGVSGENPDEEYGFAVQAGVELNVGAMTKVKLVGAYADGATAYTGGAGTFFEASVVDTATGSSIDTLDSWYVLAGLSHDFSNNVNFALTGSYHEFEDQAELWQIGTTVTYEVVENLLVRVGAKYEDVTYDNTVGGVLAASDGPDAGDNWEAKLRIQRNF